MVPWDVTRIDELVEAARMRGVRPWLAIKERLAECAIEVMAVERRTVLQGGAALHFAYHSPRLSADVDFVGSTAHAALSERGEELAAHASAIVGAPARWSMRVEGRLARGKVTIELDAARRIVLPIEAFDVPAHEPNDDPRLGLVEQAGEIAADKIVASADRLARRGTLKTTDLFDLWFIQTRLAVAAPDINLVILKRDDYGQPLRGADLGAAARAVSEAELRSTLDGVLPASDASSIAPGDIVSAAADWLGRYRDVL